MRYASGGDSAVRRTRAAGSGVRAVECALRRRRGGARGAARPAASVGRGCRPGRGCRGGRSRAGCGAASARRVGRGCRRTGAFAARADPVGSRRAVCRVAASGDGPACHLPHQRQHGAAQRRRALAPDELAARVPGCVPGQARDQRVPVSIVSHGRLHAGTGRVADGGRACADFARCRRDPLDRGETACQSPVRPARDLGPAAGARLRVGRGCDVARSGHRNVGGAARAAGRAEGAAAAHRDAHLLRLHRGRLRDGSARRGRAREAWQRGASRARGRAPARRSRRGAAAQPLPDGWLLRERDRDS